MTARATSSNGTRPISPEIVAGWLGVLVEPGSVVELRILGWQEREGFDKDRSGYYDSNHFQHLAAEALKYTQQSEGVYWTLNPVNPALLARAANRTKVVGKKGNATGDQHVLRRRWLLIDCDPQRPAGISSTDAEKELAHRAILAIRDYLREDAGWPAPILADSGNGYHLLYRIDLSADDGGLVQRCLQALGSRFDTDRVKVDTSVFNPSRICKLYGTQARKGDSTQDRPHRRARVLEIPEPVELVRAELLEALAVEAAETARAKSEPSRNGHAASTNGDNHRLDVAALADRPRPGVHQGPNARWDGPLSPGPLPVQPRTRRQGGGDLSIRERSNARQVLSQQLPGEGLEGVQGRNRCSRSKPLRSALAPSAF